VRNILPPSSKSNSKPSKKPIEAGSKSNEMIIEFHNEESAIFRKCYEG
jgi:hypothetical protein